MGNRRIKYYLKQRKTVSETLKSCVIPSQYLKGKVQKLYIDFFMYSNYIIYFSALGDDHVLVIALNMGADVNSTGIYMLSSRESMRNFLRNCRCYGSLMSYFYWNFFTCIQNEYLIS